MATLRPTYTVTCKKCGFESEYIPDRDEDALEASCPTCGEILFAVARDTPPPVKCLVAGVPLEPDAPEKKPPPPVKGEGDRKTCPACGILL